MIGKRSCEPVTAVFCLVVNLTSIPGFFIGKRRVPFLLHSCLGSLLGGGLNRIPFLPYLSALRDTHLIRRLGIRFPFDIRPEP